MLPLLILAYALIGVFAGLAAGLLGIGGGSVTVPALLLIFSLLSFPEESIMHLAIGTSLASMVVNSFSACYFHQKKKNISWPSVYPLIPGIIIGSILGTFTSEFLSDEILQVAFGLFACLIGLHLMRPSALLQEQHEPPHPLLLGSFSIVIAFLANILGIGGGIFFIPLLIHYRYHTKKAIGVSIASSFFISSLGTIGYLCLQDTSIKTSYTLGYVYLPAFAIISVTSFVAAFYGTKLNATLNPRILKKIFALSMIGVGLIMIC